MYDLTVSLVMFHNKPEQIIRALKSVLLTTLNVRIYLIDNSADDSLKCCVISDKIEYTFNNSNIGFGSAHNIAINKAKNNSRYHLILNPDVYFDEGVLEKVAAFMDSNLNVGQLSVKICFPDGSLQRLCKLVPTPFDLIARRFIPKPLHFMFKNRMDKYELKHKSYEETMSVANLSGCFMFVRTSVFNEVGTFDENIFMYTEDMDLTRRIRKKYDTIYYPGVTITHDYEKGSYKSRKLMMYHIKSAIYYFNKWGWFWDKDRRDWNRQLK